MEVGTRPTVTVATGTGLTVMATVGLEVTDSLVAVIVAVPTLSAVTVVAPVVPETGLTDSTVGSLETQLTDRPMSVLLVASLSVAVSCCVPPTIIGVVGADTVTDVTGARVTVIDEVPLCPSLVAVIVVVPAATAVTRPVVLTVAALVLPEDQITVRPLRTLPSASVITAVSCCVTVIPTTRLTREGLTATLATEAGVTVSGALPLFPSLAAVMLTVPALTAVTK